MSTGNGLNCKCKLQPECPHRAVITHDISRIISTDIFRRTSSWEEIADFMQRRCKLRQEVIE
jgi:hypothetical protein